MIYHNLGSNVDLEVLEGLHAQRVDTRIQWHREDYTLVYRASFVELAVVSNDRAEAERERVLESADHAFVGESTGDTETTWFGFDELEAVGRGPFAQDAADLVEIFVNAIVTMPDDLNSEDHRGLVTEFKSELEAFLEDYAALELDDIARYISKIGIPEEKATRDLALILELYE